jgi:flavin-dependent dehydrogenase
VRARIAIIGGGPAGAQCARALAEGGVEVVLFEPRTDHEKACGGGIPQRGLERFPFLLDPRLPGREIRSCTVIAPSGREARFPLRDPLKIFRRADLHTFLLNRAAAAGATIVPARVASFERRTGVAAGPGSGWRLTTMPPAGQADEPFDFLVAADGASGMAGRRLRAGPARTDASQGIGYFLPDVADDGILLNFFDHLRGYLWVFPRLDHASAGICAPLGDPPAARLRELLDVTLRARYGTAALERAGFYAALIPAASADAAADGLQGDGWALAGDAGGFVDPLTREGIYYAMLSGDLLAGAILAGRPERYTREWRRRCAPDLSWASRHSGGFFATPFTEALVALCARSATASGVLSDLIAGRQGYRSLKLRLLLSAPAIGWQVARSALRRPRLTPMRDS